MDFDALVERVASVSDGDMVLPTLSECGATLQVVGRINDNLIRLHGPKGEEFVVDRRDEVADAQLLVVHPIS